MPQHAQFTLAGKHKTQTKTKSADSWKKLRKDDLEDSLGREEVEDRGAEEMWYLRYRPGTTGNIGPTSDV